MKSFTRWDIGAWTMTLGLGLLGIAHADSLEPESSNRNAMVIETIYRSQCHQLPDPATMSYYFNALEDGSKSVKKVQEEITTTCLRHAQIDPCKAVKGLQDVCPATVN